MSTHLTADEKVIADVKKWLEKIVIGLNLCPFAQGVYVKNQVRFVVSRAQRSEELLSVLHDEFKFLHDVDSGKIDTTILIHPEVLSEFLEFNHFLSVVDRAIVDFKFEGILQVASFHPDYQFDGTRPSDIENYTNRSPYPILQILREKSIERGLAAFQDADSIYKKNIETMKALGLPGWKKLQE